LLYKINEELVVVIELFELSLLELELVVLLLEDDEVVGLHPTEVDEVVVEEDDEDIFLLELDADGLLELDDDVCIYEIGGCPM
jgi:hypothetical protein